MESQIIIIKIDTSFKFRPYLPLFNASIQHKILSYHKIDDQLRSFTSELLKNHYLSNLLHIDIQELDIRKTKYHKPYIANPTLSNIKFNISHSNKYVVMGVYDDKDHDFGIDIEQINNIMEIQELSPIVFSESEQQLINGSTNNFFKLWTKKEALIKALGTGFATDFYSKTRINLDDNEKTDQYTIDTCQVEDYFLSVCKINQKKIY